MQHHHHLWEEVKLTLTTFSESQNLDLETLKTI